MSRAALPPLTFTLSLSVTIRPLRESDLARLEWYGAYTHYRNLFRNSYEERQHGRREMLVAACQDYPVGRLFVMYESRTPEIADGWQRGYFYSFAVMEMFRGSGIGSRLIDAGEALLSGRGFQMATIAVAKTNDGALRLYQRHAYHIFDEELSDWEYTDHLGKRRTVSEPCWLLEKRLQPSP